jgi:hypothetical protein
MTLPTFVVIGAMKAGTVSLRHYLDEHPDVFLGRGGRFGKPNFFVAEYNWPRGRRWYESLFDGAGRAAAISRELRDRLAERLAPDLRRFEHLRGQPVPSQWGWSASVSAQP